MERKRYDSALTSTRLCSVGKGGVSVFDGNVLCEFATWGGQRYVHLCQTAIVRPG